MLIISNLLSQLGHERLQLIASAVFFICCWELAKYVIRTLTSNSKKQKPNQESWALSSDEYPELEIPASPHVEVALDPPTGLHCSNSSQPYSWESNLVHGKYIFFHPPTVDGIDQAYADYFKGKKRRWELRLQLNFKQPPPPDAEICFGTELEGYVPLNAGAKHVVDVAVAAIRAAVGGVYHTHGDDPAVTQGELEKPGCVLPLWAFDQFIVTPAGQEPPSLTDPNFPEMGQKRHKRISEFVQELEAVKSRFDTVSTYTFAFWGNSRFLDVIGWRLVGIPFVTPMDFDKLAGNPPAYAVLYNLRPDPQDEAGGRHVKSRKQYYFRAAVWSSERRPEKHRFAALTGCTDTPEPVLEPPKKKSIRRRLTGFFMKSFNCCTSRTLDQ
jgi:hypothetical protein